MHADELLAEIEPLPHPDRVRRLVRLRGSAGGPDLAALLAELAGRGHYERSTALFIASAVRDEASLAHILAAARDPDAALALRAIRLSVRYALAPEPLVEGLLDAPSAMRAATYRAIRRYRRADLAGALVGPVAQRWGAGEAAALLPACDPEDAAERVGALAHAVPNRGSLGRAHPETFLDHAERELNGLAEGARNSWWHWNGPGVAATLRHDPARALGLVENYWHAGDLPQAIRPWIGTLLDAEPERTLRLLLSDRCRAMLPSLMHRRSMCDRLARIGGDALADVARTVREDDYALRRLLRSVAPGRRGALFDAAMAGVDLTTAEFGDALLDVLPRATRIREARRMLALRTVAERPDRVRAVTAYLPYEEARPVLQEVTRRPDADDRATGYTLLVQCAGRERDPDVLTVQLESLGRLRNEQDPVRLAALRALASVPEAVLRLEHAAAVEQLAEDALNARDCSTGTRMALLQIARAFFAQGAFRDDADLAVFAVGLMKRLAGSSHLDFGRLDRTLRRGQEHRLVEQLAPLLDEGARRDDHVLALMLVRALGRRAHGVQALQDALEKALDAREDGVIRNAITFWLEPPGTRAERVERVVAKDPSTVAVPAVLAAIAAERTDLLHLVLSDATLAGRFHRADVAYVPWLDPRWTQRWTARQQAAYLRLLERVAMNRRLRDTDRGRAVATIATVPGVAAARLRPFLESADAHLRRAALTAAPWTARPQDVLPDLLAHASSDDAHVAVYAAGRAARFVRPSALAALLRPVLADGKITARKEALRILLRTRVPEAMDVVAEAWDDPDQHRDVRAAIVSAVRPHMAEPVARRILGDAAQGPRDLARQVLGGWPHEIEDRWRAGYADLVVRVARSADPEVSDPALSALGRWAPWAPEIPAVLAGVLTDLGEARRWRTALFTLVTCAVGGAGTDDLAEAAATLATATGPDAEAERDLPAAQRLTALTDTLRTTARNRRDAADPVLQAVTARLPAQLALELRAATVPWTDPAASAAVDALAAECAGRAVLPVQEIAQALADGPRPHRTTPDDLHPHAERLAQRGDLPGGLFACALTARHAPRVGWPPEWRNILRALRAHPDPEVAFTAHQTHTAAE
ncbi:hypothetical protein E1293_42035 [Actinomadura darangshiensis]|uniref:HEAT repeat domain-containing protein n=1 Tax=Actinomadura darangshiensis TaxID=705336 RepID=A0A4V2YQZ5_9ACTN|nr:hypothetical protein [Actinomadura darangshiensis]TDD64037.1 hypothetical protein E1293_42035 [Actinomadura darangshiensis]